MKKQREREDDSAVSLGEIQDAIFFGAVSVPDGRADAITGGGCLIIHWCDDVSSAERDACNLTVYYLRIHYHSLSI